MGKELDKYLNQVVKHKKFGKCKVLNIIDYSTGSIKCELQDTKEVKTLILSSKFFENVTEDYYVDHSKKSVSLTSKRKLNQYKRPRSGSSNLVKKIDREEREKEFDNYLRSERVLTIEEIIERDYYEDRSEDLTLAEFNQEAYYDGVDMDDPYESYYDHHDDD